MSRWRRCKCPLNDTQEGVYGCTQFWERKDSQDIPSSAEPSLANPQETTNCTNVFNSPSPAPSGPTKETCFFWYDGKCRRKPCPFAHETHITWPIPAPPGFVHREPCKLPLCPLREDLVALRERQEAQAKESQMGSQFDVVATSCRESFTPGTAPSGDGEYHDSWSMILDETMRDSSMNSPRNGDCRTDSGPTYSFQPKCELRGEGKLICSSIEERTDIAPADSCFSTSSAPKPTSNSTTTDLDYIAMSFSPPLSSTEDEEPLLSLSHAGTLGKRKQATSPDLRDHCNDFIMRERTPDLAGLESILHRKRRCRATHWDIKPLTNKSHQDPRLIALPIRPASISQVLTSTPLASVPIALHPQPPTERRAMRDGTPVCYYWYHKGICTPKTRNGYPVPCSYAHSLDVPHPYVKRPPFVSGHDPNGQLTLCPITSSERWHVSTEMDIKPEPFINGDPRTPPSLPADSIHDDDSSSPREDITQYQLSRRESTQRVSAKFNRLPKLTGEARARFKEQKKSVEQWQAENGIIPKTNEEHQAREASKKQRKQEKRHRKKEKRRTTEAYTSLRSENVGVGDVEMFDPGAESYQESPLPLDGFPRLPTPLEAEAKGNDKICGRELAIRILNHKWDRNDVNVEQRAEEKT